MSPEEILLADYRKLTADDEYTVGVRDGIIDTLNTLGIKIEGVNA